MRDGGRGDSNHPHFFPRKGQKTLLNRHTPHFSRSQSRCLAPSPSSLPSQGGTCRRRVPASSGKAADPQQVAPPSPELGKVVTAETLPSAASRMRAHLHLRHPSGMIIILGWTQPLFQLPEPRRAFGSRYRLHTCKPGPAYLSLGSHRWDRCSVKGPREAHGPGKDWTPWLREL